MFTGLIEDIGRVVEISPRQGSTRLGIASGLPVGDMADGESVAVDGVCLTVVARRGDTFHADAVAETLSLTTLGDLKSGDRVNLERALRLGDRIGGHLVQGHVDTTARVRQTTRSGDDVRLSVDLDAAYRSYVAYKGSVALHGVSLTVARLTSGGFEVALVPQTLERTTLGRLSPGNRVNVEIDLVARYLERLVQRDDETLPGSRRRRARQS